jgi:hypothetical protein
LETFFLENNINDLEQISKKCQDTIACYLKIFIILYADDAVILSESAESLQEAISAFEEYCNIWKLTVNTRSLILFSKKKVSKSFKNNENRKGYIFSPCFTPTSLLKNTEHSSPFRIHVSKTFTAVLNNRLNKFADEFELISGAQAGFRSGFSTVDNIFVLHSLIAMYFSFGKKLFCSI